jgi:biopolymer transport protein ExbD
MKLVKNNEDLDVNPTLDIAPLIDCVFLLLIYFMVTASLVKKEGDVSFVLPATVPPTTPVTLPVEALIEIEDSGDVEIEGMRYNADDVELNGMVTHLLGLRSMADSQGAIFNVNLVPEQDALHRRIIEVMDGCAAAGVTNLSFSKSE